MNYIEAIGDGFPGVFCHTSGDPNVYEDIVWDSGLPLPDKTTLDQYIASNQTATNIAITKYQFRKLFTLTERVAVDNAPTNPEIPANYRAMLFTLLKDLEVSGEVEMFNPDVHAGVNLLEQLGLIGVGRAAQILANIPPTT